MTEHKDICEANLLERNVIFYVKSKGPAESDPALDDIPASLVDHLDTSKIRAAACEQLILEEHEDDNTEIEKYFTLNIRDHQTAPEIPHCEQVQEKERRQQRDMDFQEELKRIMEAEKLQQMELEIRKKNAEEKLEQELLFQQELICNFKRQVEQQRAMLEEEKTRRTLEEEMKMKEKEEEDQRKRQEERQKAMEVRVKREIEKRIVGEIKMIEEQEKRKHNEQIRRENRKIKRLVEEEEQRKKEGKEEEVKRVERETKKEEKGCFMETGKMMKITDREEKKMEDELKTMGKKDDEQKKRQKNSQFCNVRVNQEETSTEDKEEREEAQSGTIDKSTGLSLENTYFLGKADEMIKAKETERHGLETVRQKEEHQQRITEEEIRVKKEKKGSKGYQTETEKALEKSSDGENREDETDNQIKDDGTKSAGVDILNAEKEEQIDTVTDREGINVKKDNKRGVQAIDSNDPEEFKGENVVSESQNSDRTGHFASSLSDPSLSDISGTGQQQHPEKNTSDTSEFETSDLLDSDSKHPISSSPLPASLPELTEQKRLSWMKYSVPWYELSHQKKIKQKGSLKSQRKPRRSVGVGTLAPICPNALLKSTGRDSLQEVSMVSLEALPACSLSTLSQCIQLRSLTLRRCGLRSLEGLSQLKELHYVDLGENDISFLDCENMSSLRVLRLAHNKLTSIHGLSGVYNLDVLDLSHNFVTRIAGLESLRRLQRLFVDHNQLISTKGLTDVYTLLHLDCSHNHLANVAGLEKSALLQTLDLRSNSLTEPPSLNNQVLLRELLLDDNSISSLQGLASCWLPLLQDLCVSQNRVTQLPSMTDFVSLKNLDLRYNCLSELQNVCENLEECLFLQEVHLTGNPLQQESDWRFKLQKAVAGLRDADSQQRDSFLSLLAFRQPCSTPFLMLCQVHLQQTQDLQQRLNGELRRASASPDALNNCCHYFTRALQLAEDQRFAHEYGHTTVSEEHVVSSQTVPEETLDMDKGSLGQRTDSIKNGSTIRRGPDNLSKNERSHNNSDFEDTQDGESQQDTFESFTTGLRLTTELSVARGYVQFLHSNGNGTSTSLDEEPDNMDSKNTAAIVIQRTWRIYREKCDRIKASSIVESRGHAKNPLLERSSNNNSIASQDRAATVIQAFWRGCALRRRLASALAAFTGLDTEEDTFEEVDVEEFVVDELALEEHWPMTIPKDSPPTHYPVPKQHLSPKLIVEPKQAWVAEEQGDSGIERYSAGGSNRSKFPASTLVHSGLSERSEEILQEWGFTDSRTALLMLKRAQKMKATKKQQPKHGNPSIYKGFRGCNYRISPAEAKNGPARNGRRCLKVVDTQLRLEPAQRTKQMKGQQAQQEMQTHVALVNRRSERGHFLPEINSSILGRGRVQLVAELEYTEHAGSNSSLITQHGKVNRSSTTHASKQAIPPKRVSSPVGKKERISFREIPVQLSSGWGGGKKRDRLPKN